jgi:DNA-binding response OmpR family regulator
MAERGDLAGMTILVVEDNFLVAEVLCEALREYGCEIVGPAPDCARGQVLVETGGAGKALTGALLDVNLNGETSFKIAGKLRDRGIPFIFLTGYGDLMEMPHEFESVRRIGKPCDFDELAAAMRAAF